MNTRRVKKEWTLSMRANHWAMVMCILVLIPTGFYIASPFCVCTGETIDKFLMGNMRYIHVLFGVILLFVFFWRIYLAFFSRHHADWKDFFAWTDWKNTIAQIKFYALVSEEKPVHRFLYGPLQSIAYGGVILMLALILLTGIILAGAGHDAGFTGWIYSLAKPFQNILGGLATIRFVHHILTWLFIVFVIVHIYMAFWYDVVFKEGTVSSMINGRLFKRIRE